MGVQEAFEKYCRQNGITSEQYKEEIRPVWDAAYRSALVTKLVKEVVGQASIADLLALRDAVADLVNSRCHVGTSRPYQALVAAYEKVK